jgi:hypothetical protein
MYYRVADSDSKRVLPELAADVAKRSLEIEAAPAGSTPRASKRSVTKRGLCFARLLNVSNSPHTRSSQRTSALHHFALGGRCRGDVPERGASIAQRRFAASDIGAMCDWADRRIGRGPRDWNRVGHWPGLALADTPNGASPPSNDTDSDRDKLARSGIVQSSGGAHTSIKPSPGVDTIPDAPSGVVSTTQASVSGPVDAGPRTR